MGVEMLTDLLTGHVRGDGLVASLVGARFGIVFEILSESHLRHGGFNGNIAVLVFI